jgi:hypothetical protein
VFEHDVSECGGILDGDVHEEVVDSGHMEDLQHPRDAHQRIEQRGHLLAGVIREAHLDDGLQRIPECSAVDADARVADDSAFAEAAHPVSARRLGESQESGERLVRDLRVASEHGEQFEVELVERRALRSGQRQPPGDTVDCSE